MRILLVAAGMILVSATAQAGEMTCWYDAQGMSTGGDWGNLAEASDSWHVVDVSQWNNPQQVSALYMTWGDEEGTMDGSDCPQTLPQVDGGGWMPMEGRPQPH